MEWLVLLGTMAVAALIGGIVYLAGGAGADAGGELCNAIEAAGSQGTDNIKSFSGTGRQARIRWHHPQLPAVWGFVPWPWGGPAAQQLAPAPTAPTPAAAAPAALEVLVDEDLVHVFPGAPANYNFRIVGVARDAGVRVDITGLPASATWNLTRGVVGAVNPRRVPADRALVLQVTTVGVPAGTYTFRVYASHGTLAGHDEADLEIG